MNGTKKESAKFTALSFLFQFLFLTGLFLHGPVYNTVQHNSKDSRPNIAAQHNQNPRGESLPAIDRVRALQQKNRSHCNENRSKHG